MLLPKKLQVYEPTVPAKDKATVYIYRAPTSVDSLNPDIPRFFLNDTSHGKLTIGGHYVSIVNPGEVYVYYKEGLFGIPFPWKSQEIKFNAEAGKIYFVKYGVGFELPFGKTYTFGLMPNNVCESEISKTRFLKN